MVPQRSFSEGQVELAESGDGMEKTDEQLDSNSFCLQWL